MSPPIVLSDAEVDASMLSSISEEVELSPISEEVEISEGVEFGPWYPGPWTYPGMPNLFLEDFQDGVPEAVAHHFPNGVSAGLFDYWQQYPQMGWYEAIHSFSLDQYASGEDDDGTTFPNPNIIPEDFQDGIPKECIPSFPNGVPEGFLEFWQNQIDSPDKAYRWSWMDALYVFSVPETVD